jgi:cytochrome c-type biogenesis protein CcmE
MKTYMKFGVLMALIVGALLWLALGGISDSKTYYRTIAELKQMGNGAQGQKLRVGGDIQSGSIVKGASEVTFVLSQAVPASDGKTQNEQLKVVYTGSDPLPDTFKDGAQALADGRLSSDGVFEAKKIQAKCASKYEAKPQQKGLTHDAPTKVTAVTPLPTSGGSSRS